MCTPLDPRYEEHYLSSAPPLQTSPIIGTSGGKFPDQRVQRHGKLGYIHTPKWAAPIGRGLVEQTVRVYRLLDYNQIQSARHWKYANARWYRLRECLL